MGVFDTIKDTVDKAVDEAEDQVQGATGVDFGGSGGGKNSDDVKDKNEDTSQGVTDNPGRAASEAAEGAGQAVDSVEDTVQETTGQDLGGSGGGSSDTDTESTESAVDVDAGRGSSGGGSESDVAGGGSSGGTGGSDSSGSGVDVSVSDKTRITTSDPERAEKIARRTGENVQVGVNAPPQELAQYYRGESSQFSQAAKTLKNTESQLEGQIARLRDAPKGAKFTVTTGDNTRTLSRSEALKYLQNRENTLEDRINKYSSFAEQYSNTADKYTTQAIANDINLDVETDNTFTGSSYSSPGYTANPLAIQKINQLQNQLTGTVMPQEQREQIKNRIDELQTQARQSAELPGGTNIPGQTPYSRIQLPKSAQDEVVSTAPNGPVEKFGRALSSRFKEFTDRPEPKKVGDIELNNDLPTQVAAGLTTLASSEGYTYAASFVPGGRSPEDVAEERIEEDFRNPSTGPERVGEAIISSPAGLVATAGAGAAVGAGGKVASVLGSSGRVAQVARGVGAAATGLYAGSQAGKVAGLVQKGKTTKAGGEALRTVAELGAFGKGYRAFQRYDAPVLGRTSVTQADNTLRQLDEGFTGAGRMTARTKFQRGPFSRKVLGMDETGEVATDINYRIVGDETQTDFRGTLTQELPDSDETAERSLEGFSRVVDEAGGEGGETVTRDVVRTKQKGRLFQYYDDFTDTSVNRRIDQERVNTLVRTDDEFIARQSGESFVNPSQRKTGLQGEIPVDAQISRYESFSVADNNNVPADESFGSTRTLIFRNADEGTGGATGSGLTGSGGGDSRYLTVQELGGVPAGGSPVSSRGLYSQARSAARNALGPNTGGYEVLSGGAGVGIGRQALQNDGQRSVNQFGGQEVQNFQAQGDVTLSRNQIQSQRFSQEGGQMLRIGGVQVQRTGGSGLNQNFRGSITEQLGETRTQYQGENLDTIRGTPSGSVGRERDQMNRPVGISDRINRISNRGRARTRTGLDLEIGLGQGQRGFQNRFQDQFQFQGTDQISFQGARTTQVPRLQLRGFQRYRTGPVTTTVTTGRPGRPVRARPGLPGFDFGGFNLSGEATGTDREMIGRGRIDPTYDILSAQAVEASTDEQARFDVSDTENIREKQEELGAFVRNKAVQAQNLEYGKSSTGRRRFF